jgi:hypothetical protein
MWRPATCGCDRSRERGIGLVLVVVATAALSAIVVGLAAMLSIETRSAAYGRERQAMMAAVELAVTLAIADLASRAPPDPAVRLHLLSLAPPAAGSESARVGEWDALRIVDRTTAIQRSLDARALFGADTPRLVERVRGFVHELVGASDPPGPPVYVMTWLADDPADRDNDPTWDTNGVLEVWAEASGAPRLRVSMRATVRRQVHGIQVVSWRPGS